MEFADKNPDTVYKKDTVIHNPQIIRDVVKISGCRFKIVPRPDAEVKEDEVSHYEFCQIYLKNKTFKGGNESATLLMLEMSITIYLQMNRPLICPFFYKKKKFLRQCQSSSLLRT